MAITDFQIHDSLLGMFIFGPIAGFLFLMSPCHHIKMELGIAEPQQEGVLVHGFSASHGWAIFAHVSSSSFVCLLSNWQVSTEKKWLRFTKATYANDVAPV